MKLLRLLPRTAMWSWMCTAVVLFLEYRYTLKKDCHEFGCQTDWDLLFYGLPIFFIQLAILTPMAAYSLWSSRKRTQNMITVRELIIVAVLIIAPIAITIAGQKIAIDYVNVKLKYG